MTERSATFRDRYGLHPRSAHRIQEVLAGLQARVTIEPAEGGHSAVDARSMLGLIGAGIRPGEVVRVTADGPDELAALDAIVSLMESGVCHP